MTHFGLNYPWKKRETFEIQKSKKEEKENEPRVLSWMVDYIALHSMVFWFFFFANLRIVVDYLCKRILKGYSFDWSVNFFSPDSEKKKVGKKENETKWKRTEKDLEKYVYYFEIIYFFKFFALLNSYICLRCVFSFYMVSEKMMVEKVMGLYIHFFLIINIRVFLKIN